QDTVGSLSLAGVAGHGIAVIEMGMLERIELDRAATVHLQAQPPVFVNAVDGPQLAVRNFEFVGRRGELNAVARRETPHLLPEDRDSLLSAWIVGSLRAVLLFNGQPVFRSVDALHLCVLAFPDTGLLRCPR